MVAAIEKLLNGGRGEWRRGLLLFLYLFFVMTSYVAGKTARDSLFLARFRADQLPFVDIAVAVLVGFAVAGYLRASRRTSVGASVTASLVFFSAASAVLWFLARGFAQHAWVYPVIYIWVGLFGVLAPAQVWTVANYTLTTREAKRVFGLVGSGAICGWIFGGFLSARAGRVRALGTESLLLAMAVFLAMCAVLMVLIWRSKERADARCPESPAAGAKVGPKLGDSLRLVAVSPYLRTIAVLIFASSFVTTMAGWQFKAVAQHTLVEKNLLSAFFGEFNLYAGILSLALQLLLTSRLLRRFGLGPVLLVMPLALMISSFGVLVWGTLFAVILLKGSDQVLRYSVDKCATELLYLPVDLAIKVQAKSFIDTVIWRFGDGFAGLVILLFATQLHWPPSAISRIILVLIPGWIAAAMLARRYYVMTLRASIRQHRLDADQIFTPVLDRNTTYEVLRSNLTAGDADSAVYALGLLQLEAHPRSTSLLQERLAHPAPEVRRKAAAVLASTDDRSVVTQLENMLRDPDVGVRSEALMALSKRPDFDPLAHVDELASFPDVALRVAIAQYLAQPGKAQNLEVAAILAGAMAAEAGPQGKPARLAAARLLTSLPDHPEATLRVLLADPDVEVAREAVKVVGNWRQRKLVPELLDRLSRRELASVISETLLRFGDAVVGTLRDYLADSSVPVEIRRRIPRILAQIGTPAAAAAMSDSLLDRDAKLRVRLIAGLQSIRQVRPELPLDNPMVEAALALQILEQYRLYRLVGALSDTSAEAASPATAELMQRGGEGIFALLGLLHPHSEFYGAYFGLQSTRPTVHDNALEFLDNVLRPEVRRLLVPLLDSNISVSERAAMANRLLGTDTETGEGPIRTLLSSDDAWLRRCGVIALGVLQIPALLPVLGTLADDPDASVGEAVQQARARSRVQRAARAGR